MELTSENSILIRALEDLDEKLFLMYKEKGTIHPIELNVVGGFALMMNKIRLNPNEFTDIDYIGEYFDDEVKELIDTVGIEYNLGKGWINNDVMLWQSDIEDMFCSTGTLHFKKMLELKIFTVNVCDPRDILRMKVIAIDTQIMGADDGGEFTRAKDFKDIRSLMFKLGMNLQDVRNECEDYIVDSRTFKVLKEYILTGKNEFVA